MWNPWTFWLRLNWVQQNYLTALFWVACITIIVGS